MLLATWTVYTAVNTNEVQLSLYCTDVILCCEENDVANPVNVQRTQHDLSQINDIDNIHENNSVTRRKSNKARL